MNKCTRCGEIFPTPIYTTGLPGVSISICSECQDIETKERFDEMWSSFNWYQKLRYKWGRK
jgi:hypothetical protein